MYAKEFAKELGFTLSPVQEKWINGLKEGRINVAIGNMRSGKSFACFMAILKYAEENPAARILAVSKEVSGTLITFNYLSKLAISNVFVINRAAMTIRFNNGSLIECRDDDLILRGLRYDCIYFNFYNLNRCQEMVAQHHAKLAIAEKPLQEHGAFHTFFSLADNPLIDEESRQRVEEQLGEIFY
jgi:hypothetical protein